MMHKFLAMAFWCLFIKSQTLTFLQFTTFPGFPDVKTGKTMLKQNWINVWFACLLSNEEKWNSQIVNNRSINNGVVIMVHRKQKQMKLTINRISNDQQNNSYNVNNASTMKWIRVGLYSAFQTQKIYHNPFHNHLFIQR